MCRSLKALRSMFSTQLSGRVWASFISGLTSPKNVLRRLSFSERSDHRSADAKIDLWRPRYRRSREHPTTSFSDEDARFASQRNLPVDVRSGVKLGGTQNEHNTSGLPPRADIARQRCLTNHNYRGPYFDPARGE